MTYPESILGPITATGDIVQITFDHSELTLRLPKLHINTGMIDQLSSTTDFIGVDTSEWEQDCSGQKNLNLVLQNWTLEDKASLDDVASCFVRITLTELSPEDLNPSVLINSKRFKDMFFSGLKEEYEEELEEANEEGTDRCEGPEWPCPENDYLLQSIPRPHVNWLKSQLSLGTGKKPSPFVLIPINERFYINISFKMSSLHYPDRKNPHSDETLRALKFKLFDDFIDHIGLEYSDELIGKINTLSG